MKFRSWIFLGGLVALASSLASAEVLTLYSDAGVAGDNVAACGNSPVCAWGSGAQTFDGNSTAISPTPEGVTSFRTSNPSGYAGWGIFYDTVVLHPGGVDLSRFRSGSLRFWIYATDASVIYTLNLEHPTPSPTFTNVDCTDGRKLCYNFKVPVANQWVDMEIPISPTSQDVVNLYSPFEITANSATTFYIDYVRYVTSGTLASIQITPPSPVAIPLSGKRTFTAVGLDASGSNIDTDITWSVSSGLGTLSSTQGPTVTLTAPSSPVSGTITASSGPITNSVSVNVGPVTYTQTFNVYSDAGVGGTIGTSTGTAPGSSMTLAEQTTNPAPGSTKFMHGSWTMVNSPGLTDAFSFWYVGEPIGSRFMQPYANGFLQFWVRSTTDLQVSLRSANIAAGAERCKFRLSALGVPLDGTWQEVTIALTDFKTAEPNLDFTQIANYFTIGVLSSQVSVGSGSFDVAAVQWLTTSSSVIDPNKVYAGLIGKQNSTTGLVLSYDNDATGQSYTYDQALAAMNFTYQGDTALAKKVFDAYRSVYIPGSGFDDIYNRDTKAVMTASQTAGPNAWMLMALLHYRSVTGQTTYDTMMNGLATWLLALQDSSGDGGLRFGYNISGTLQSQKSTEHNLDAFAVFNAYYAFSGNPAYQTAANQISNWLQTKGWNSSLGRFNVGLNPNGTTNTDKALDIYSWAPLATSSYTVVLAAAQTDFRNTQTCDLTGFSVDGFDMGGTVGLPATYTDAVWLEGTSQMADAYWSVKDQTNATYFINQIEKAILPTSASTEGLAYATNRGTGYNGVPMDSLDPAVSSMAWYLFAKNRFNPFRSYPILSSPIRNIADNKSASAITWTGAVAGASWVRADQYLELDLNAGQNAWGIQIYTDNTAADANPKFASTIPSGQPGSNPAGMIGQCNPSFVLPLAWSIQPDTTTPPAAGDPQTNTVWFSIEDKLTPDISVQKTTHFTNGAPYVLVKNNQGIQISQGSFVSVLNTTNPLYLEANFNAALGGCSYQTTTLRLEYFYP